MHEYFDIYNNKIKTNCLSCSIINKDIQALHIASSKYFIACQDFEVPIPGFIIISSKLHIFSIDNLSLTEQFDLINFICKIRKIMRNNLNIQSTKIIQEESSSSHLHIWIFSFHNWMEKFGKKIDSIKPIIEFSKQNLKTYDNIKKVEDFAENLKFFLMK